ncbi:MAG: hypothetical protein IJV75_01900 [Alphaproteobacteria bacterium]|nr:hypothetical protein [Alphaproteobacteria bacterium]
MKQNYESGRSMVEMLGTLAIIGVLSVGAIAGYSYGMDKYRANQTINDVMLLGVDIITQLSQNRGTPTLSAEWGTKTTVGYDFTVVPNPSDDTQYGIQISGVPARVCKMVGDALKPMASVYVNDDEHITEEDPCDESDSNTMEFYFDTGVVESDGCKTDADCGTNKYCDMGLCFNGVRPEMTGRVFDKACTSDAECNTGWTGTCSSCDTSLGYCVEKYDMNNAACTLSDGTTGKCGAGECLPTGCTYDTNKKCDDKEYCASPNNSCTEAFQSGESGSCVSFNARFSPLTMDDGTTYYVSNGPLSWWDADAACKSVDKSLLSVSDLVTESDGSAWEGDYDTHSKTVFASELYSKGWNSNGYPYIWTNNLTDGVNSCFAYFVYLSDGYVDYNDRNYGNYYGGSYYYAVCR